MFKYIYNTTLAISTVILITIISYIYNIYISLISLLLIWLIIRELTWLIESYMYKTEALKHGFYLEFLTNIVKYKPKYIGWSQYEKISAWYDDAMRKHVRQILSYKNKITK